MKYALIRSIKNTESLTKSIQNTESLTKSVHKYRISLAVVLLIIQWSFKRFHFRYRHLKVFTEVAFLICKEGGERIPDDYSRVHE